MTAYNVIRIWCDQTNEGTGRQCTNKFEVVADTREKGRQIAAEKGWSRVAASGADEGDRCPDHKPATEEAR